MTQLIVRPIDDKRYSKSSQLEYLMLLKKHKSLAYSDAFIKFILTNYREQLCKAFDAFAGRMRDAIQSTRKSFSQHKGLALSNQMHKK